jgi:phosphate transport system substrate-binding protein
MIIRMGLAENPASFTYQIGTDNLLVIVNLKNPTSKLSADQARGLFSGQIHNWKTINGSVASVQVWVFPPGEDIQEITNQTVLKGSAASSSARLANNPNEMLQAIKKDVNAVGIITGRWKNADVAGVYTVANSIPVLAITSIKPQGTLARILACMQK